HIGERHRRYLRIAECGQDVGADLLAVVALRRRPLARDVVGEEALAEVGHRGSGAGGFLFADGIGTAVDLALEPLGFFGCRRGRPVGERADGDAALLAIELAPVVENEGASAGGGDANAEAADGVVPGDLVAAGGGW